MNRRTLTLVGAALLALLAAGVVYLYVGSIKGEVETGEQSTTVLVAAADIPARTSGERIIEKGLVETKQIPRGVAALGAATDESHLQGKILVSSVAKGQQIVASQLAVPEAQSLSFQIKPGMRAVSVAVDRVTAVGGTIRAGDRVDVISTIEGSVLNEGKVSISSIVPGEERRRILEATGVDIATSKSALSRIILQQVEVLRIDPVDTQTASAVSQETETKDEDEAPNSPVATLMVTAHDAERIVFAQELGSVSLILVPAEDRQEVPTPGALLINEFLWSPTATQPVAATVSSSD